MTPKEEYELTKRVAEAEGMKVWRYRDGVYVGVPGEDYWGLSPNKPWTGTEDEWGLMTRAVSFRTGNRIFKERFSRYVGMGRDGVELILAAKGF